MHIIKSCITGPCEWLNKKHTIFGKVTGNTIYNIMRLNDVEVNNATDCRPLDVSAVVIRTIEVLWNPFDDIVPRNIATQKSVNTVAPVVVKSGVAVRDKKLLSFAEEDEESEPVDFGRKMHSSHSSSVKPADSNLVDIPAYEEAQISMPAPAPRKQDRTAPSDRASASAGVGVQQREKEVLGSSPTKAAEPVAVEGNQTKPVRKDLEAREAAEANEYQQMKQELLRSQRAIRVITGEEAATHDKEAAFHDMTSLVEQRRQKYLKRKKTHGDRENETLAKLESFKSKLSKPNTEKEVEEDAPEGGASNDANNEDEDNDDSGWYKGKLKFVHHPDDKYRNN